MNKWERILGIVGALASITAVVDTYVLKSRLADALSLPSDVPTGLAGLFLLVFSVLLVIATRGNSGRERLIGKLEAENAALVSQVQELQDTLQEVQSSLARSQSSVTKNFDLPDKVYAVLVRREASFEEIGRALNLDGSKHDELMGAIAKLVKDGRVTGGSISTNYRVTAKPQMA